MTKLAQTAATETFMGVDAGPFTSVANNKAGVTFTPNVDCDVLVTVDVDFSTSNAGGAAAFLKGVLTLKRDGTTAVLRSIAQWVGAAQSIEAPMTMTYRFSGVPASVSTTINIFYTDHAS